MKTMHTALEIEGEKNTRKFRHLTVTVASTEHIL